MSSGADAHTTATGDYLANGDNYSYPDVTNYQQGTSRSDYVSGVFRLRAIHCADGGTNGNENTIRSAIRPSLRRI